MVGSAIVRKLESLGYSNLIFRTRQEVDLTDQAAVRKFFETEKPNYVYLAAAKVGGIQANNTYRAEFLYDNLLIEANVIDAAYRSNTKKLLFLGSSCIYPKLAQQPMNEKDLLAGYLEPTNEPYAIAKIAGIKLCESYRDQYGCNFISAMPTNLYGPNDNYDLENSHVLPALLRKFHEAKTENKTAVVMWGTGSPLREFLHVDDLADACVFLMDHYDDKEHINIGSGKEISIIELARQIMRVVGFEGTIEHDLTKPDGTPRKLLDSAKLLALGWNPKITLELGLKEVYRSYLEQYPS